MTKEHILPAFLLRRYPDQKAGIPPRSGRVATFEGTIRDVCGECNSGSLSELDAYAKSFTEQNRCHRTFDLKRPTLLIIYEYQMLLRWLLKISFNVMRAGGHETAAISQCAGFILGSAHLPFHAEVFVEVIRNLPIAEHQRQGLPASLRGSASLTAHRFRLGAFGFPGSERISLCRFVAINAFYFYVMLFPAGAAKDLVNESLLEFRRTNRYALRLSHTRKSVSVKVSKNTIGDVYREQFLRELPAWEEYFSGIEMSNL